MKYRPVDKSRAERRVENRHSDLDANLMVAGFVVVGAVIIAVHLFFVMV